jgi:hypothetical protein
LVHVEPPHASYQHTSVMKVKTLGIDLIDKGKYQQVISCQKLEICLRNAFANHHVFVL